MNQSNTAVSFDLLLSLQKMNHQPGINWTKPFCSFNISFAALVDPRMCDCARGAWERILYYVASKSFSSVTLLGAVNKITLHKYLIKSLILIASCRNLPTHRALGLSIRVCLLLNSIDKGKTTLLNRCHYMVTHKILTK